MMRGPVVLASVLALLAVGPSACGGGSRDEESGRGDRLLVAFAWSGGIAGRHERLSIDRSGRGRLRGGPPTAPVTHEVALSPSELTALRDAVDEARIDSLHDALAPSPPVPDGFVYRIVVPGGSVTFGDGGPEVSPAVGRLTSRLRTITQDAGTAGAPTG